MAVVSLIVMEPGSEWPGHVGVSENVVAIGHHDERLLERTRQRLDSLRQRGDHVRVAVLACNEATDDASVASRKEVAQELASAVAATRFGRLVLSAAERASVQLRHGLISLAGALSNELRGTSVWVRFTGTGAGPRDAR